MNILVIKQSAFGDVLHSTGHISAIREQYRDANIVVLTSKACAPLLKNHPAINTVLEFDRELFRHSWLHGSVSMLGLIRTLRQQRFDLAIDLQGRARTAVFLYCARARRKFIKGNFPFINGFKDKSQHAIDEMSEVLRLAGVSIDAPNMTYTPTAASRASIDRLVITEQPEQPTRPFVVISPFSTHPAKDWPLKQFAPLVTTLLHAEGAHYNFFFTGTKDRADEIERLVSSIDSPQVTSLAGELSIDEFAALTARAALVITSDSFPMHLAAALSTPLLCFFGPTRESQVGPRGGGPVKILRAEDCDNCARPRLCERQCLRELPAQTVGEAAATLLTSRQAELTSPDSA